MTTKNKIKTALIFLFLLILTACIVFLPYLASIQIENKLLSNPVYCDYNIIQRTEVTSKQVANLFYNNHITGMSLSENIYEKKEIKEDVINLFDIVFESDAKTCKIMKKMIKDATCSYTHSSVLIMLDNHPVALDFVNALLSFGNREIAITYEKKTKTLIYFTYYSTEYPIYYDYSKSLVDDLEKCVDIYYRKKLDLSIDNYYLEIKDDDYGMNNFYFGILQRTYDYEEDNYDKEIMN